jgi:hypothetical protein
MCGPRQLIEKAGLITGTRGHSRPRGRRPLVGLLLSRPACQLQRQRQRQHQCQRQRLPHHLRHQWNTSEQSLRCQQSSQRCQKYTRPFASPARRRRRPPLLLGASGREPWTRRGGCTSGTRARKACRGSSRQRRSRSLRHRQCRLRLRCRRSHRPRNHRHHRPPPLRLQLVWPASALLAIRPSARARASGRGPWTRRGGCTSGTRARKACRGSRYRRLGRWRRWLPRDAQPLQRIRHRRPLQCSLAVRPVSALSVVRLPECPLPRSSPRLPPRRPQ